MVWTAVCLSFKKSFERLSYQLTWTFGSILCMRANANSLILINSFIMKLIPADGFQPCANV